MPYGSIESRCKDIALALFSWAQAGFPTSGSNQIWLEAKMLQSIVIEWLLPNNARGCRYNLHIWKLAFSMSNLLALHDLWHKARNRTPLRVILRAFHQDLQQAILNRWADINWRKYVRHLLGPLGAIRPLIAALATTSSGACSRRSGTLALLA